MTWTTRPRSDLPGGIAAIEVGQGDPLVLIHGVGLTADSWGAQIDVLASSYRVIAMDLPGHGQSRRLQNPETVADFAEGLIPALESLGTPVLLAGHSLGALISLHLATLRPDLCRAVAPLNCIHRRSEEALQAVKARAASMDTKAVNDPTPTLTRWFGEDLEVPEALACRAWLTHVDPVAYKEAYNAFAHGDSPSDLALAAVPCPMFFLTGAEEPNSTPAMSQALSNAVPKGQAMIVEGAAHMAMMTHPETVNTALSKFFGGSQ